jgi:hypothetical protein
MVLPTAAKWQPVKGEDMGKQRRDHKDGSDVVRVNPASGAVYRTLDDSIIGYVGQPVRTHKKKAGR